MASSLPPNGPARKPTEPWRVERMVQRVPGHIDEGSRFSPWLIVAAIVVIVLVGSLLLIFSGITGSGVATGTTQNTRTPRAVTTTTTTTIRVTATVESGTATPSAAPTGVTLKYTVKKGDTLSSIAQKFKVSVQAIRAANSLSDDTIKVGDVLTIPVPTPTPVALAVATLPPPGTNTPFLLRTPTQIGLAKTPALANGTTPTATPGVVVYTVRQGDTLISIAGVFSTTVQAIMSINKFDGPSIRVGQPITVPVGVIIPTLTPVPTIAVPSTATVTPQFTFAAPDLISPKDNADIAHNDSVVFQWLSVGELRSDESYVLHVRCTTEGLDCDAAYQISADQGNAFKLETAPVEHTGPAEFLWYVVVVRGSGCGSVVAPTAATQPCAVSPVSEPRTFTWR